MTVIDDGTHNADAFAELFSNLEQNFFNILFNDLARPPI